jgi:hypothetical protein
MANLTAPRNTPEYVDNTFVTITAGGTIYEGGMVAINGSGAAVPAAASAGLKVVGRAENQVTSGGIVKIRRGVFGWDNDTTNAVVSTDVGKPAYVVDDHTVTATSGGSGAANIVAGIVKGLDENGQVIVYNVPLTAFNA